METKDKFSLISIVIPALNEENVVGKTLKSIDVENLKKLGLDTEIILVDNDSIDNTAKEARQTGARVVYEKNHGYGNAYLRGFKEAKGDIIVMGDADGTYPLDEISEFIQPILKNNVDFIIGSRLKGNIQKGAMPWLHRYVGNPILTSIMNFLFKLNISDAHCGMRAITKEALQKMNLQTTGMEFATEMIVEAARRDLRITEIPIEYKPRKNSKAKLASFRDGWRHLRFMLIYSPDYLYLFPGLLFTGFGFFLMVLLLIQPIKVGVISLSMHPMAIGSLFTLLGTQILLTWMNVKYYAVSGGYIKKSRMISFMCRHFTLERAILIGVTLIGIGTALGILIVRKWYLAHYRALDEMKMVVLLVTLMVIGSQIVFSSFFLSVLRIKRKGK